MAVVGRAYAALRHAAKPSVSLCPVNVRHAIDRCIDSNENHVNTMWVCVSEQKEALINQRVVEMIMWSDALHGSMSTMRKRERRKCENLSQSVLCLALQRCTPGLQPPLTVVFRILCHFFILRQKEMTHDNLQTDL